MLQYRVVGFINLSEPAVLNGNKDQSVGGRGAIVADQWLSHTHQERNMSETQPDPIKLEAASLSMPTLPAGKKHFSTAEFLGNLKTFRTQTDAIIARLQRKIDEKNTADAFEIEFVFNFFCNESTETSLTTDKNEGVLKLTCYCNGGG